jgi:Fe-S-cluster containining protein
MKQKPWYKDGLQFTCTQCGDCCRTHGDYQFVYVPPDDADRLAEHFKVSRTEFFRRYTDKGDEGVRTLKWPDEACVFLGPKGCTVYLSRPEQCRTWPFWPENMTKKVWKEEIVPFCPGAGEGKLYNLPTIRKLMRGEGETRG